MQKSVLSELQTNGLPWMVFQLARSYYAVNTRYISAISRMEGACVPIPESKGCVRGLTTFRGTPIQVLDLRILLGFEPLTAATEQLKQMVAKGKGDHLKWVSALEQSVAEGTPFQLATDPHQCAFGQWYDHYTSDSNEVNKILRAIDDPHTKLHQSALQIAECGEHDNGRAQQLLEDARSLHFSKIMKLLDQLMRAHDENMNELMIVLEHEGTSVAVVVDKVIGVQDVEPQRDANVRSGLSEGGLALAVAQTTGLEVPLLLLDDAALLTQA